MSSTSNKYDNFTKEDCIKWKKDKTIDKVFVKLAKKLENNA